MARRRSQSRRNRRALIRERIDANEQPSQLTSRASGPINDAERIRSGELQALVWRDDDGKKIVISPSENAQRGSLNSQTESFLNAQLADVDNTLPTRLYIELGEGDTRATILSALDNIDVALRDRTEFGDVPIPFDTDFDAIRTALVQDSRNRQTDRSYKEIVELLELGDRLQKEHGQNMPEHVVETMMTLVDNVREKLPGAASRSRSDGIQRNQALQELEDKLNTVDQELESVGLKILERAIRNPDPGSSIADAENIIAARLNARATKNILKDLYDELWGTDPDASYSDDELDDEIYSRLGTAPNDGVYHQAQVPNIEDTRLEPQTVLSHIIKNSTLRIRTYSLDPEVNSRMLQSAAQKRYDNMSVQKKRAVNKEIYLTDGDYYHIIHPNWPAPNERIIMNLKSQAVAAELVQLIADKWDRGGNPSWEDAVVSAKFFAHGAKQSEQDKRLKYDKTVIYFENDNDSRQRHDIIRGINTFLADKGGADALNPAISGFYGRVQPGIGFGQEIADTSFTTERTDAIVQSLSGKTGRDFASRDAFANYAFQTGRA